MAASSGDPLARWIEETVKDAFGARAASNTASGGPRTAGQSRQVGDGTERFVPITPLPLIPAGLGLGSERLIQMLAELPAPAATHAADALTHCHTWLPWSLTATAATLVIDVFRLPAHRHRDAIATQVLEATLVQPRRVWVPVWRPGLIAPRRAVVTLPRRGTVLKDDRLDVLAAALDKAANPAADPHAGRLMQRLDLQAWTMRVRHVPASVWRRYDRLVITRHPVPVDARTPELRRIDTALEALRQLPDARATVVRDGDDHAGYDITYSPTLLPGRAAFQQQIRELLVSFLGSPVDSGGTPTGWMWTVGFLPESDLIQLRLAAPLPKYVRHEPVAGGYQLLKEKQRHRIPYATAAGDLVINWNLGWSSSVPHFLGVGPTGGGKAVELSTPIATPSGWTTMGELRIGDTVFDEQGKPCRVTGVYDQPLRDNCYKVTFSDGATIVADGDHQWFTHDRAARISQVEQQHAPRTREPWLSPGTVAQLRTAAAAATPGDGITISEAAALAGVCDTSPALQRIAKSLGPIRIEQRDMRCHYAAQTVSQRQRVRVYDSELVTTYLLDRVARSRRNSTLATHAAALVSVCTTLRDSGELSTNDIATALQLPPRTVADWLRNDDAPPAERVEVRRIKQVVPQRIVTRRGRPMRVFSRRGLLTALADHGERPMRDQRHLRALGQVRSTDEIRASLKVDSYLNHSIPVADALELPDAELPVAPYTLGAWLGDGWSGESAITSADPEIIDRIRDDGYLVTWKPLASDAFKQCRKYRIDGLRDDLRMIGVFHKGRGTSKHIPNNYLRASKRQRQELLAGLLDTDGTVKPGGAVQYTTITPALAEGVTELARSLGYRAVSCEGRARLNGRDIGPKWTISFTTTDPVFHLSRKNATLAERTRRSNPERNRHRYITSVEKVSPRPMRCITVDSPNSLFLAGPAMIPTHNTSLIRTLVTEMTARGIPVIGADPKMIELVGLVGWPGVATVVYSLRRMVLLISALHAEMHARLEHCMRTRMPHQELQMLGVVLDEFFIMSGLFNRARRYKGEDPDLVALANLVNNHDPLGKVADLAAMGRSAGIRLIIGVQRPDADIFGDGAGSVRDNFRSRASLSNLSLNGALMMWDDAHVGRDLDASVPGRATVCTDDGSPIQAQIWWTPDLDQHPRKWEALSQDDRDIVDALRPEGDLEYIWYSDELIQFVAESATPSDSSGPVGEPSPEPVGGLAPESDAVDDGVRAAKLVAGDRIHLDDGSTVTVAKVTKPRGGKVLVTVEGEGRVQTQIELDRNDVVLADKPVHLTESEGE